MNGRATDPTHLHAEPGFAHQPSPEGLSKPWMGTIQAHIRLISCFALAVVILTLHHPIALLCALLLSCLAAALAGLNTAQTLRRMASLEGFMILVLLFLPFSIEGETLFSIAGFAASYEGLARALSLLAQSNAIMLLILALPGTLEAGELGQAMQRLHVPDKFIHLFLFTLRYIDVMRQEYRRLRQAMQTRGFQMRFSMHSWKSLGYLFGMLMIKSLERSERIVAAMLCRGFQGKFPSLTQERPLSQADLIFAVVMASCALGLLTLEWARAAS